MAILDHEVSYRNGPYVVTQNMGAFVEVPEFLDSQHKITAPADAEAYLERLQAYARALDGETARLRHDSAAGVTAPSFILDKTIQPDRAAPARFRWRNGASSPALLSARPGFPKDFGALALKLATEQIAPALDRQIEELRRQRPLASADAGVWRLPQGDAYYAWALRAGTTSDLDPAQVHQMGLEQLAALQARMEPLLRAQGLTQGTPGERMTALGKDPRNLYPNTDAGREQILAYVNGRLADIRTRLPRAFATLAPGNLLVKRVPPAIENGAPDGYAGPGHHRRLAAGPVLHQPARHLDLAALRPADPELPRGHPRPCLAGGIHLQAAADPLAAGIQRLLGRLGAIRRAARRRARRL